jgi:hypothetical protein
MMKSITLRYMAKAKDQFGNSIAGRVEEYACNGSGEGIFKRNYQGFWDQWTGTGQTPVFQTPESLRRYLRRNYGITAATMVKYTGW